MLLIFGLAAALCKGPDLFEWAEKKPAGCMQMCGLAVLLCLCVFSFSGVTVFYILTFKVQPSSVKRANHARMNEHVLQRMSEA